MFPLFCKSWIQQSKCQLRKVRHLVKSKLALKRRELVNNLRKSKILRRISKRTSKHSCLKLKTSNSKLMTPWSMLLSRWINKLMIENFSISRTTKNAIFFRNKFNRWHKRCRQKLLKKKVLDSISGTICPTWRTCCC